MGENNEEKVFRFALYQEDILFCEKVFDAEVYNPFTRYSIDIRDLLPQSITRFQRVLSRKSYDVKLYGYNLYELGKRMVGGRNYNPHVKEYRIDTKTIRGVECKLGLYINQNPIVERMFYVDGFNPVARFSTDVTYEVLYVAELIADRIKSNDVNNMWDDYALINQRGLTINQIRELPPYKRADLLRRLRG